MVAQLDGRFPSRPSAVAGLGQAAPGQRLLTLLSESLRGAKGRRIEAWGFKGWRTTRRRRTPRRFVGGPWGDGVGVGRTIAARGTGFVAMAGAFAPLRFVSVLFGFVFRLVGRVSRARQQLGLHKVFWRRGDGVGDGDLDRGRIGSHGLRGELVLEGQGPLVLGIGLKGQIQFGPAFGAKTSSVVKLGDEEVAIGPLRVFSVVLFQQVVGGRTQLKSLQVVPGRRGLTCLLDQGCGYLAALRVQLVQGRFEVIAGIGQFDRSGKV